MPEAITSPRNPLVKLARSLRQRKARRESGLFLAEGILHAGEAVAAGWDIKCLLYAPEALTSAFAAGLIAEEEAKGIQCLAVTPQVFEWLAEKEHPQGIIAIVRQRELTLEQQAPEGIQRGVALVSPQDPGNLGTILRTLDAVRADALFLLDGGVDPFHPSTVRASMGALFWKPVFQASFDAFIQWARRGSFRLIGTSARGSLDYRSLPRSTEPFLLILGSEQKGLSSEQAAACDLLVRIPMRGRASSLNLAVTAGILLYQLIEA